MISLVLSICPSLFPASDIDSSHYKARQCRTSQPPPEVAERAAAGSATPLAWATAGTALIGITVGTLHQKRFGGGIDWRPAMFVQYAAAGVLFSLGAATFETRVVHWTPQFVFAFGWLVFVLSYGAIWLLYSLIRRSVATRVVSLFYLTPPVTALTRANVVPLSNVQSALSIVSK
jgi:drug/metabolite transporter (DMT)-like permease